MTDGAGLPRRIRRRILDAGARIGFGLWRLSRGFRLAVPDRLLIAPQELEPGDPITARDIYGGLFVLAGRAVQARGQSPFMIDSPSAGWLRALHGFDWLRHFRDADALMVQHHARALVAEWLATKSARTMPVALLPEVTARRVIAWLMNATVLLGDADHAFYGRFMRALARQALVLDYAARRPSLGMGRTWSALALAFYTVCARTGEGEMRRAARLLAGALGDTILPDGTPLDRNPQTALDLACLLLPLRTAYGARGRPVPPPLDAALERLYGFLALMRHPTGELALFNGAGASRLDILGAVMDFAGDRSLPPSAAPFGGYQRLEAATTLVIADAGAETERSVARSVHAGTLAFEVSARGMRIIVNCGAPPLGLDELYEALRRPGAHSTLDMPTLADSLFVVEPESDGTVSRHLCRRADFEPQRAADDGGSRIVMDGAVSATRNGPIHRRVLRLSADGDTLSGEDTLEPGRTRRGADPAGAMVRFHLHPALSVRAADDGSIVRIDCPNGDLWLFEADGVAASIEDSVYFGGLSSQRLTRQIVVPLASAETPLRWRLFRLPAEDAAGSA